METKSFKEWLKLHEMPISNMQFVGQWGPKAKAGHGYNWQDLGILENPAAVNKIVRKWSNSKENFEIYFARSAQAKKHVEVGQVSREWVKENLGFEVNPQPDTIAIIFTQNTGTEKIPMTAWAIAHRLGHAIRRENLFQEYMSKEITRDFRELLRDVYGIQNQPMRYGVLDPKEEKELRKLAQAVGTMSSARQGKLVNFYEFIYEIVAQYIITGKVTFNPLPETYVRQKRSAWGKENNIQARTLHDPESHEDYNQLLQGYAEKYEHYLDSIFSSLLNKIFVM